MYKRGQHKQIAFENFNQPMGLKMNPNNRWIVMADYIPWDQLEKEYASLFQSHTGNVAKPLRMALGSLIIQNKYGYSDEELVDQLTENPYYQYFIGLPGYQDRPPFDSSTIVGFRKRITAEMLMEANEALLKMNEPKDDDHDDSDSGSGSSSNDSDDNDEKEKPKNKGKLILDATCAPSNIRYPQDFSLLNEAREHLEKIVDRFCKDYDLSKPRMYRVEARKNYLSLAKSKKRSQQKIRSVIRKQLGYVRRDLGYLETFMSEGYAPTSKEMALLQTIRLLYQQQEYMYKNKTHSVENRIVSIQQPFIRPIVRGKAKAPVEFGVKFDMSVDEHGFARVEKLSFDAYNESACLQTAVEGYKLRTGRYPECVLVDAIYRTRKNRAFCKERGIRMSGPKLGRPGKNREYDKAIEYQDNVDRIEVERQFSVGKRCYGLGLVKTKHKETTMHTITLSVFVMNLFKISLRAFFRMLLNWLDRYMNPHHFTANQECWT
jgi:hypothetical protein